MTIVVIISLAGVGLCGALVIRHAYRTSPKVPANSDLPQSPRRLGPPIDVWQGGIKIDVPTDYHANPAATKRLMKKLQREEVRQKPWEARN